MTHNPADPHDPRNPEEEPIWEILDFAVEGKRPAEHAAKIETLLRKARGVKSVEADANEARVYITYDSRVTDPAAIHELLLERGYKAAAHAE